jgi:hypothetical protein
MLRYFFSRLQSGSASLSSHARAVHPRCQPLWKMTRPPKRLDACLSRHTNRARHDFPKILFSCPGNPIRHPGVFESASGIAMGKAGVCCRRDGAVQLHAARAPGFLWLVEVGDRLCCTMTCWSLSMMDCVYTLLLLFSARLVFTGFHEGELCETYAALETVGSVGTGE